MVSPGHIQLLYFLHFLMNSRTIQGKRKMKIYSDCETEDDNARQDVVPNHQRKLLWPLKILYYFYNIKETPKKL